MRARRPRSRRTTSALERPRRLTADERERLLEGREPSPFPDRGRPPRPAPWGEGAWCQTQLVRFSDIDLLGHVNNVRYLDYVQEATTNLLLDCLREAAVDGHVDFVVARTEIDYLGQMNLRPEPYDVWARVTDVGTTSVTFEAEIRDGERVMARCRAVEVSLDERRPAAAPHPGAPRGLRAAPGGSRRDARSNESTMN